MGRGTSRAPDRASVHMVLTAELIILTGATWDRGGTTCVPAMQRPGEEHHRSGQDGVYRKKASVAGAEGLRVQTMQFLDK